MSSGAQVEKEICPATVANAVNRIRHKRNAVIGSLRRGALFPLEVPISQPAESINRSLDDVKGDTLPPRRENGFKKQASVADMSASP
jgi:hypothetical protein